MEDSWDNEDFEPPALNPVPKGDRWEGEDEDDEVKENWEDEEEEEKKDEEKPEVKPLPTVVKKKKLAEKIEEKERKEQEVAAKKLAAKEALKNLTPEEKMIEKLRQQRLQEEADLQVTKETFGIIETSSDSIDALNPSTQEEFDLLEEAITKKLQPLNQSVHYPIFVEKLLRSTAASLNSSNLKKLKIVVDNLYTEKQKVEKEKSGTKKATKSKPSIKFESRGDIHYGAGEDVDFDY